MYVKTPWHGEDIEHIPGAHVKGIHLNATPDQRDVILMRQGKPPLGPAPAPPLAKCGKLPLRDYQRDGVAFVVDSMRKNKGAILADDMGLGKTLQTIAAWQELDRPYPLLVLAPAPVRRGWVREFKKWLDVDAVLVEDGKKAATIDNTTKVVVTSYQLAHKALPLSFCPHVVVLDELHNLRGRTAQRAERLKELSWMASYRLGLTGTPMWGRPRDLWQPLKMLFHYQFGTADEYDFAYCGAFMGAWGNKENKGVTRSPELRARLAHVMLRRTKEDVAKDLPPLTRNIRWLPADKNAKKALESAVLGSMRHTDALKAALAAKIDYAVETCLEAERYICFTWMKTDAIKLHAKLVEEGSPCELITGDLTQKQREDAIERAIRNGSSVVATIDSCGVGVDRLQFVSSNVIFHAIDPTPTKTAQAEARAHRIGQASPVFATFLALADSADELIVERVVEKLQAWTDTMGRDSTARMKDVIDTRPDTDMDDLAKLFADE